MKKNWQELRLLRSQNRTNTNQFSRKIGWNVEVIAVDDEKRRADSVSNKKIEYEEVI